MIIYFLFSYLSFFSFFADTPRETLLCSRSRSRFTSEYRYRLILIGLNESDDEVNSVSEVIPQVINCKIVYNVRCLPGTVGHARDCLKYLAPRTYILQIAQVLLAQNSRIAIIFRCWCFIWQDIISFSIGECWRASYVKQRSFGISLFKSSKTFYLFFIWDFNYKREAEIEVNIRTFPVRLWPACGCSDFPIFSSLNRRHVQHLLVL